MVNKKIAAARLRLEYPSLQDATDDEAIEVARQLTLPESSTEEWDSVLTELYPTPAAPEKKSNLGQQLLVGGLGIGLGAATAALHMKPKVGELGETAKPELPETPVVNPTPEGTPEVPIQRIENPSVVKRKEPVASPMATTPPETPAPEPTISSRALHQFAPENVHTMRKLERDPQYLKNAQSLSVGTPQSHVDTWNKAFNSPPMSIDELSSWDADRPVSNLDEARANILRTYWWDNYLEATKQGDAESARKIYDDVLVRIEPGYHNLTGTPGRALEFQKVVQYNEEVINKVSELRAVNAPFEQFQMEIDAIVEKEKRRRKPGLGSWAVTQLRKIDDIATAMKLSGIATHAVNTISNAQTYLQLVGERYATAGLLQVQGRPSAAEAYAKYAWGTNQGFIDGADKFLKILLFKEPLEHSKVDKKLFKIKWGPPLEFVEDGDMKSPKAVEAIYRLLGAADAFWKTIYNDSELHTKSYIQAKEVEKLDGVKLGARIKQLVENPPPSWKEEAKEIAQEGTFQDSPDRFLKILQAFQSFPLARTIIPFVSTPYNITKFHLRRSVFGIVSRKFYRDLNSNDAVLKSKAIARLGIGLGLTGAAFAMVNLGHVTGPYPSNPKEKQLWIKQRKRPWSFQLGKYWISYNRTQPLGFYMMEAAAAKAAFEDNKFQKSSNKVGKLVANLTHGPLDLTFLQGMSSLIDLAQDPEKNMKRFFQLYSQGFFPTLLRDVQIQIDPTQRKPSNVKEAMEAVIPGLSKNVSPRRDVFGEEVKLPENRFMRGTKMTSEMQEDDKTKLMEEIGWTPPVPETELSFRDQEAELPKELKDDFLVEMGEAAKTAMDMIMSDSKVYEQFKLIDNFEKKRVLTRVTKKLQTSVQKDYKALVGLYGPKLQKEAQEKHAEWKRNHSSRMAN